MKTTTVHIQYEARCIFIMFRRYLAGLEGVKINMFSARLDSLRKFQISFFWSIIDLFLTISKIKFNLIRIRHYTHKGYEKPEISYHTIFHPHP